MFVCLFVCLFCFALFCFVLFVCFVVGFFFCIFVNDLPLHIHDKNVRNFLFVDESSLDTGGKTVKEIQVTLQKSLNEVSNWCKSNVFTSPKMDACHGYLSQTATIPSSFKT